MNEPPKMAFIEERFANDMQGAEYLAAMVRVSIYEGDEMPPAEFFNWFVEYVAYTFVEAEYQLAYAPTEEHRATAQLAKQDLEALRIVIAKNKQFGAEHKITEILRVREIHLPAH